MTARRVAGGIRASGTDRYDSPQALFSLPCTAQVKVSSTISIGRMEVVTFYFSPMFHVTKSSLSMQWHLNNLLRHVVVSQRSVISRDRLSVRGLGTRKGSAVIPLVAKTRTRKSDAAERDKKSKHSSSSSIIHISEISREKSTAASTRFRNMKEVRGSDLRPKSQHEEQHERTIRAFETTNAVTATSERLTPTLPRGQKRSEYHIKNDAMQMQESGRSLMDLSRKVKSRLIVCITVFVMNMLTTSNQESQKVRSNNQSIVRETVVFSTYMLARDPAIELSMVYEVPKQVF